MNKKVGGDRNKKLRERSGQMKHVRERRGPLGTLSRVARLLLGALRRSDGWPAGRREGEIMTNEKNKDEILHDHNHDGIDRRGFLKCMAWAGTGALCVMQGGVLKSYSLSDPSHAKKAAAGDLSFVQISD